MGKIKQRLLSLFNSGAVHITVGSFITKFVSLFGSIFVIQLMTKSDYGILQYIENIYGYIVLFAGFGLPFSILRHVIMAENGLKRTYLNYAVSHSLFRDVIISVLLILANSFISYPENFQAAKVFIPVLAILLPFQTLVTNGLYSLRSLFRNKEYAAASLLVSTLLIVGRIIGAKVGGLSGVVWLRLFINIVCGIVLIVIVYKIFPKPERKALSREEEKDVNIYSMQYMFTNGLWVLFMLNDSFLLGLLTNDPAIVADYKVAYLLPGNLSLISNAIGVFIAPHFTRNEKDCAWVRKTYKQVSVVNALAVLLAALFFFVFAKPIISVIYGEEYLNTVPLMRVLLVGAYINSGFRYATANILSAMGKVKSNLAVSSAGIVVQVALDIVLIPRYGAMGVAYSNCIVFIVMSIALFLIFYKNYFYKRTETC